MAPTVHTPPINTYVPIESIVLTNAASSVSFFNIAQSDSNGTYKDLVLVVSGQVSGTNSGLYLRFNGDSGNNYSAVIANGNASGIYNTSYSSLSYIITNISTNGSYNGGGIIQVFDYSATDKHSTVLYRGNPNDGGIVTSMVAGRWANTSTISSISLAPASGTLNAGSTFSLYAVHG